MTTTTTTSPAAGQKPMTLPSSGSGFGSGTATGIGIGMMVGGPAGAAIGGGIGLLGDLANLYLADKAAKEQKRQTAEQNLKAEKQYNQEFDENKRRYGLESARADRADNWNKYKESTGMLGAWSSNFFDLVNRDANAKQMAVSLWRKAAA